MHALSEQNMENQAIPKIFKGKYQDFSVTLFPKENPEWNLENQAISKVFKEKYLHFSGKSHYFQKKILEFLKMVCLWSFGDSAARNEDLDMLLLNETWKIKQFPGFSKENTRISQECPSKKWRFGYALSERNMEKQAIPKIFKGKYQDFSVNFHCFQRKTLECLNIRCFGLFSKDMLSPNETW